VNCTWWKFLLLKVKNTGKLYVANCHKIFLGSRDGICDRCIPLIDDRE
jgi:hypothetical protein